MTAQLTVLVVDDHQLLAQSLAVALRAEGMRVDLADLSDRDRLVRRVRAVAPDLVLLDLELGGAIGDGSTLVRPFVQAGARVLVVSASTDRVRIANAIEQGALGQVAKTEPFDTLLRTAIAAAHGECVLAESTRHDLLTELRLERQRLSALREPFERLTHREQQVLHELCNGRTVSHIAADWFVSEATVRTQVRAVLQKLGVGTQLEAVAHATRAGWLVPAG